MTLPEIVDIMFYDFLSGGARFNFCVFAIQDWMTDVETGPPLTATHSIPRAFQRGPLEWKLSTLRSRNREERSTVSVNAVKIQSDRSRGT